MRFRRARPGSNVAADDLHHLVPLSLAPGLASWEDALTVELGGRFEFSVRGPGDHGIAVVDLSDPVAIRELRAAHPDTLLVVVLRSRRDDARIGDLFDAGADVVASCPDVRMLAAHLRALVRRGTPPPGGRSAQLRQLSD